ncbi:uncharacterized protein LOC116290319 [Actinia tenebrosa]|uniref:Uncharacterized protein LOC116290319 n=1 Tax=Actinia tenebrosa TaxID=6105 RepID=A0A6P8H9R5_ACTTE|nr:uncharacterized protein LOC116290319 [Actinia tenebrosa]XP_031553180.1 uncharacterized protein LOC116290319 [Actinia tenebrosa]
MFLSKSEILFKTKLTVLMFLSLQLNGTTKGNPADVRNWTTCEPRDSSGCQCTSDNTTDVIARCQFDNVTDLKLIIGAPQNVVRLNLFGNNIQYIPRFSFLNFTQMIYLNRCPLTTYTRSVRKRSVD